MTTGGSVAVGVDTEEIQEPVRAAIDGGGIAWRPIALVAAVAGAFHLMVATRYGWHHDEFYYVICGRHPAFGYVDQPPAAPLLARFADAAGGLFGVRLLAIVAQLVCIVLTGVLASQFGARRAAQTLAAAAVAACPVFVAASMLFGTTVLDQAAWAAVFVLVTCALRENRVRWWAASGAVAGLGFEGKNTIAVLVLGIAVGVVVHRREVVRTPGPWVALAVAGVLAAPNVVWDALHGWPNLTMDHTLSQQQGGPLGSLARMPELPLLLAGPPLIGLWWLGLRWLRSPEGRAHRWLVPTAAVVTAVFVCGGGKVYYPAPLLMPLFAAGAVAAPIQWYPRRGLRSAVDGAGQSTRGWLSPGLGRGGRGVAISALVAAVIGLPILPPAASTALRFVNPELMQTYGWPRFTHEVAVAAAAQPASVPIFTSDFGEAGALTILGPGAGLRRPVYSGHDNYVYWGPPAGTPDTVLCVGKFPAGYLSRFWGQVTEVAPITLPAGLKNAETDRHAAIYLCRQPRGTWAQLWPQLHHVD
ncbi:4-amino-4-deoxy-L-arabinose transferase-like glycosyltransferase [Catenulispora sp. MAP12-49]